MLRIAIITVVAFTLAVLVMRLSPRLRAKMSGIMRSPFVRQILIGVRFASSGCCCFVASGFRRRRIVFSNSRS